MPLEFINPDTQTTATTNIATTIINNSAQTNYISFPVATANPLINGWRTYADSATTFPVDGTGGSPNTTLTQNTSSPLNSTGDFRLNKSSGASRQGEGFSTDFTIANRHLSKVLQLSFDYELVSGTLATDDIRLYVIQDPTSGSPVVLEPVNVSVQGVNTGIRARHLATFQTHISITSYRLCVHISTTTNSSQIIDFNNFRVWEPSQSIGSIITDPTLYTPTLTNIPLSSSSLYFHREGTYGFIQGTITLSGGGNTGEARVGLPSGWVISSIITSIREVGRSISSSTGFSSPGWQGVILAEGGTNYLTFGRDTATTSGLAKLQGNDSSFAGLIYTINAKVPIAGWGSNVAMSSDSGDGRVVAFNAIGMNQLTFSDGNAGVTDMKLFTIRVDTHGSYSSANGQYTVPVSGIYRISAKTYLNSPSGGLWTIGIYKDGSRLTTGIYPLNMSAFAFATATTTAQLRAGEKISIRPIIASGGSINCIYGAGGGDQDELSIERISAGSQTIGTNETVACEAVMTSSNNPGTDQPIRFNFAVRDTHSAYNTSTFRYTIPMSGWYQINFMFNINTGGHSGDWIYLFINGTRNRTFCLISPTPNTEYFPSNVTAYFLTGDIIDIRSGASTAPNFYGDTTNNTRTRMTVHRIGI